MIRTLLSSDNTATVEDIARAFVNSDPSQLEYYKQIAKRSISGSMRYDVLAKTKGICAACGVKASSGYPMHVDHIVPASLGGKSILENLQPLCFRCNTEKRNRDDTDFLKWNNRLKFRQEKI